MSEYFRNAAIAFDLDGTLADTAPDLIRALNVATASDGLAPVPLADLRMLVGRGARVLIERAYARQGRVLEAARTDDLVARFIEAYRGGIADNSRLFPGVLETLDELRAGGARLSVCTNKPSELADLLLTELRVIDRFERVVGPERAPAKKPDPAHLLAAWGEAPARMAMVGDSAPDVLAAKAAAAPVVVLTHGYSETPAGALGADRVLDDFRELPGALVALWRGGA
ncbi:MAG: HAD-IA family hydrolase [Maricaulaceae bacterium]|nr:HAD-IA family hydrolase [Maricaulaceae bacterium]